MNNFYINPIINCSKVQVSMSGGPKGITHHKKGHILPIRILQNVIWITLDSLPIS